MTERCFACNKPLKKFQYYCETSDGQGVYVGRDCWVKAKKSGSIGYQPPLGGPRLYDTLGHSGRITVIKDSGK